MTRKSRTTIIAVLLLLAVALYFIAGTYARYAANSTGTGTANIAKWNVKVGGQPMSKTFDLTLTPNKDSNIATGKFAPTSTLTSEELQLDLTGTEVAVDVTATVNDTELKKEIGDSKITTELKLGEDTIESGVAKQISLGEIGTKVIKVTVKWDNDGDKNSESDTNIGTTKTSLSIPVTLKVEQHIGG